MSHKKNLVKISSFGQSGGASQLRVCYQRGLPCLVFGQSDGAFGTYSDNVENHKSGKSFGTVFTSIMHARKVAIVLICKIN